MVEGEIQIGLKSTDLARFVKCYEVLLDTVRYGYMLLDIFGYCQIRVYIVRYW